jgi:uncharacterized lipoprotein
VKNKEKVLMTAFLFTVLLSGCQQLNQQRAVYIRDREQDYLTSTVIAPLRVPADLSYMSGQEHYAYPAVQPGQLEPVSLVPPGFGELSHS